MYIIVPYDSIKKKKKFFFIITLIVPIYFKQTLKGLLI